MTERLGSMDTLVANNITQEPSSHVVAPKECPTSAPARIYIARYDQYFDQRTFSYTLRKTKKPATHKKLSRKKPIIVVRRIINSRGQHEGTAIDIKDGAIRELLIQLNKDVRGLGLTKTNHVADAQLLFHSRKGLLNRLLEEKAKDAPDEYFVENIVATLQFTEEDQAHEIQEFTTLTALGKITFGFLWALIPPNTFVYREHPIIGDAQVLLCRRLVYGQDAQRNPIAKLECDIITHDGSVVGYATEVVVIKDFPGACKIPELSCYPLEWHENRADIYEHAIQRGKRFTTIERQLFEAGGSAFGEKVNMLNDSKLIKFNTHGRVMIDPAAFRLLQPNSGIQLLVHTRVEDKKNLAKEEYLICSPVVLGFCFGTKMWGGFSLDRMKEVVWSEDAFKQLVLGPKHKQLIHALIRQHSSGRKFDDIVVGKGKGLIGLLAGNPGCGKTLTAEAVAEITHRPLYIVSAGELGTGPQEVDNHLSRILELAHLWDAVLLLDEAEVFLHKRTTTDLSRNALVSIFLRQLEYYQGILILTTNMIGQVDAAFESRIHFCVKYPDLDFESRLKIWKTFLEKASENLGPMSEKDIERLAERKLNGRQIKNAVSSAQSIAIDQESQLLVEHIDTVLEVLNDW